MNFDDLNAFIKYGIRPQENYQYVMIKGLLLKNHQTKDEVLSGLKENNQQKQDVRTDTVTKILLSHNVVTESSGVYSLKDFDKLTAEEKKILVKLCNEQIEKFVQGEIKRPNYWKIAPGEQASEWDDLKSKSIIGIGWNDTGDLDGKSIKEAEEIVNQKYPDTITASQFRNYLKIKPGDIVIANKGKRRIVGIGRVLGEYRFDDRQNLKHTYPIDWFYQKEKEVSFHSDWGMTVRPTEYKDFCSILSGSEIIQDGAIIPDEIEELVKQFDENKNLFSDDWKTYDEIKKEQTDFVTQFPINEISEIQIDQYVQGKPLPITEDTNRTTFCYLLENGLESFGSGSGGDATKFGAYYNKKRAKYEYDEDDFNSIEESFSKIKEELTVILQSGGRVKTDENWNELSNIIDDQKYHISRHIVSKILAIYFPDTFVSIHSNAAINTILKFFKLYRKEIEGKLQLKKSILNEVKTSHPIMKNWTYQEYGHFLWRAIVKPTKLPTKVNVKVISISKGSSKPGCEETNSCYSPNIIKIDLGDVITWKNDDDVAHNISSGTSSTGVSGFFESGLIKQNEIFSYQFDKNGTFHYFDSMHPWMTGQIIVGDQETISEEIEHAPLKFPSKEKLEKGVKKIQEELLIDSETIKEIVINLASGRHILLAGPIGTGKTQLAIRIPKIFWTENNGYYPELYTATSEWSPNDVIGGIMPKMKGKDPIYEVQLGCVSQTAKDNWDKEDTSKRILSTHNDKTYHGTWLVIDEFNRAEIDKAMGQLFTSLETKMIKIPTTKSNEDFEEVIIPKDYRIIGTLNTADKHYLFKLSDALKRRFAYIEVLAPTIEQKDQEIYFAMKNALKEFEHEDLESMIILDEENKKIDDNSNQEFLKRVNSAYDILAFVRIIKPLGTAVLKSIYQTLVVGSSITDDLDRSLDSAINVNLIPQLENAQISSLELILEYFFDNPVEFFKKKSKSTTFSNRYENEFKTLLEFLKVKSPDAKIEAFKKGTVSEDVWTAIQNKFDGIKIDTKLPMFENSLKELIKTSSML
jgi:MoxR-like ATPase/plastocyanin